jgi:hypothetical protein
MAHPRLEIRCPASPATGMARRRNDAFTGPLALAQKVLLTDARIDMIPRKYLGLTALAMRIKRKIQAVFAQDFHPSAQLKAIVPRVEKKSAPISLRKDRR